MEYSLSRRFLDIKVPAHISLPFIDKISPDTIMVHIKGSQCHICLSSLNELSFSLMNGCVIAIEDNVKVKIKCETPCEVFKMMISCGVIATIN